ncbi:MAG: hypothetical protein JNL72_07880 [Flavipsychrobacter sp.]|nr:hypothetical protein [Flavipsychrobacter sp.]
MQLKAILLAAFAFVSLSAAAQDKIYKRNGEVIDGKVKEVNTRNISYKRSDNPDGPDYVVGRNEVEKIKYQNGLEDYISGSRETTTSRKPGKKIEYGSNVVTVALVNLNDEGFGFGAAYERALDKKGILSFYLPVNVALGGLGNYTSSTSGTTSSFNRAIWQIMPGIKFYPTGSKGKVRYAVGPQLSYETGYKEEWQTIYDPQTFMSYQRYDKLDVRKLGILVNNSLNMSPNEHMIIGLDLGLGFTYMNKKEDASSGVMREWGTRQLAQFNFRIGYRF